ncbi:hypothetical protein FD754_007072 [Muntiacus muntjak]|uniref:HSR domain-containing protein n=1 Tax=Muntiacus muntjak TaxID=9888 RepID=A0A5N3WRM8_MUNMU|nr:hypothetical protein FD754_007072 [Muntiacus muntjak]
MITGDQNPEEQHSVEQLCYEFVFTLFKENKVEIANAIPKLFPFLMGLRDRDFISESMYEHFQEACRNLVPVERVMYDVLSELEKKFDKTVLEALFSQVNLKAYPDLLQIRNSFQNGKNLSFGAVRCKLTSPNRVENLQGKASTYPCIGEGQHGKVISGKRNGRLAEPRGYKRERGWKVLEAPSGKRSWRGFLKVGHPVLRNLKFII